MRLSEGSPRTRAAKPAKGRLRGDAAPTVWRFDDACSAVPAGTNLRIEVDVPAMVHWSSNGWRTTQDADTEESAPRKHALELPTAALAPGSVVAFTFYWKDADHWEGRDFLVTVAAPASDRESDGRFQ
ncbi:MAG: hypothetical protein ACYCQK_03430 [Acidiferrobacteraceae bacterium]